MIRPHNRASERWMSGLQGLLSGSVSGDFNVPDIEKQSSINYLQINCRECRVLEEKRAPGGFGYFVLVRSHQRLEQLMKAGSTPESLKKRSESAIETASDVRPYISRPSFR